MTPQQSPSAPESGRPREIARGAACTVLMLASQRLTEYSGAQEIIANIARDAKATATQLGLNQDPHAHEAIRAEAYEALWHALRYPPAPSGVGLLTAMLGIHLPQAGYDRLDTVIRAATWLARP